MIVVRPGKKVYTLSDSGIRVVHPAASAAAGSWYLGPWPATAPFPAEAAIPAANCLAAYQPHWGAGTIYARADAASYANSKINLANPGTYNATEGTAPDWASGVGWEKNASGHYLKSGIVASAFATISGIAEFSGATGGSPARYPFGAISTGGVFKRFFTLANNGAGFHYYGYGGVAASPGALTSGNLTSVSAAAYLNGVFDGAIPAGSTPALEIYILDVNVDGTRSGLNPLYLSATAFYNITLTANQVANIAWAMGKISGRVP